MPYYDQLITQAVDRFEAVEVTEEEFEPPDHLSVDERLSNAFGISSEEPMDRGGSVHRGAGTLHTGANLASRAKSWKSWRTGGWCCGCGLEVFTRSRVGC